MTPDSTGTAFNIIRDVGRIVGINKDGNLVSRIQVHVRYGVIRTAYPY